MLPLKNNTRLRDLTKQDQATSDHDIERVKNQIDELKNRRAALLPRMDRAPKSLSLQAKFDELSEQIRFLQNKLTEWEAQEVALANSYYNREEGDIDGTFGRGVLGKAIKAVAIAAATPVTLAWRFAENHPFLAAGIVLGTQIIGVGTAPLQTSAESKAARRQHRIDRKFYSAVSECRSEQALTVTCAEKLLNSWEENRGDLERQIHIENIMAGQHLRGLPQDGYAEVLVKRAIKWKECVSDQDQDISRKCQAQFSKYTKLAEQDVYIYLDHEMAAKELVLDKNIVGNSSSPTLERRLAFADMSTYPYLHHNTTLHGGWCLNKSLGQRLATLARFNYYEETGQIFSSAGMVAYVFENQQVNDTGTKEICLAFGGTTSGKFAAKGTLDRIKSNFDATMAHLVANAASVLSLQSPALHEEAIKLALKLEDLIEDEFDNAKLVVTGHSLGGGLCTAAAAMTGTANDPTECFGFASGPVNGALKSKIARRAGNVKHAKLIMKNIHHTVVEGDPVPKVRNHVSGAGIMGEILTLDAEGVEGNKHAIYKEAVIAEQEKQLTGKVQQRFVLTTDKAAKEKRDTVHQRPLFTKTVLLDVNPPTEHKHNHHNHHNHHKNHPAAGKVAAQLVDEMVAEADANAEVHIPIHDEG